jgi:hypothetical protein
MVWITEVCFVNITYFNTQTFQAWKRVSPHFRNFVQNGICVHVCHHSWICEPKASIPQYNRMKITYLHKSPFSCTNHSWVINCVSSLFDVVSWDGPAHSSNCQCHLTAKSKAMTTSCGRLGICTVTSALWECMLLAYHSHSSQNMLADCWSFITCNLCLAVKSCCFFAV